MGLESMSKTSSLKIPRVFYAGQDREGGKSSFIVMSYLDLAGNAVNQDTLGV